MEALLGNSTLSTTATPDGIVPEYVGFIAAGAAVLLFGSNFVPLKRFDTGDGAFFQWVLCISIWIVGLVAHAIRGFPPFWPLAMVGGFLWTTGNICVVPIVKTIGLAMGILLWASLNLFFGWASGRFGWFGLQPEEPPHPDLNYVGVALSVGSTIIFLFVQSSLRPARTAAGSLTEPLLSPRESSLNGNSSLSNNEETFIDKLSPLQKRILGSALALTSGIFYGLNFLPVIYVKENYPKLNLSTPGCDHPKISAHDIDYAFSHFTGILATSTLYFIIYCIYMRNKPRLYPQAILPGIASGIMWAIAQICFFIANESLSEAVSFPIISAGPGVIGALWGVFVFKEIRGKRNYLILTAAITVTIAGAVVSGLSKMP